MAKNGRKPAAVASDSDERRAYVSQSDIPSLSLDQALRVAKALADDYAGKPQRPLAVAQSLGMTPTSGTFRGLCGAAIAYGLTEGGAAAPLISLTSLGKRIVLPTKDGDELIARREALLNPRIIGEFLRQYDQAKWPKPNIARNVLVEVRVPRDSADRTFSLITEGAQNEGLLREIKGDLFADLTSVPQSTAVKDGESRVDNGKGTAEPGTTVGFDAPASIATRSTPDAIDDTASRDDQSLRLRRVFIAHGKNTSLLEPIKKLLKFGELEAVVSAERSGVSIPVPDKVMGDMRTCGASIIHVDAERVLIDKEANEHVVLNPNVLIEIGGSMALYGRRFILLVREGVKLPSNLQGLHEVRYTMDSLDGDATIRLLEAINDIKNHALPLV